MASGWLAFYVIAAIPFHFYRPLKLRRIADAAGAALRAFPTTSYLRGATSEHRPLRRFPPAPREACFMAAGCLLLADLLPASGGKQTFHSLTAVSAHEADIGPTQEAHRIA